MAHPATPQGRTAIEAGNPANSFAAAVDAATLKRRPSFPGPGPSPAPPRAGGLLMPPGSDLRVLRVGSLFVRVLHFLAPSAVVLLAFVLAWTASHWHGEAAPAPPSAIALPNPQLGPADVVKVQLAGLANREHPSLGILQCYYFASPANLAVTGTLDTFGQLVRRAPYDVMAAPRATLVGDPQVADRTARVLVTLIDAEGQLRTFVFLLEKQTRRPYVDCWMTDAVRPIGEPSSPAGVPRGLLLDEI